MEPLPETRSAIEEFGPFVDDLDLLEHLQRSATLVRAVVPSCVGLSLAMLDEGLTFTLRATSEEITGLDAVQYLADGPCVEGALQGQSIAFEATDPLDEARWSLFARATAAAGVASTLTLPIVENDRVVGSVNLYASQPHAFDSHHEHLALILDAWAPGAITDADMRFETRRAAQRAPEILREQMLVAQAVGTVIASEGIDPDTAQDLFEAAAARAGLAPVDLARLVLETYESFAGPDDEPEIDTSG